MCVVPFRQDQPSEYPQAAARPARRSCAQRPRTYHQSNCHHQCDYCYHINCSIAIIVISSSIGTTIDAGIPIVIVMI